MKGFLMNLVWKVLRLVGIECKENLDAFYIYNIFLEN